jgi:ribosomal protein S18 acetylase RimI-like enzyme
MSKPEAPKEISLRDAGPEDEPFLLQVYSCTRADEMALVPWSDEQKAGFVSMQFTAQHNHYHERYPRAAYKIIQRGEVDIGRLYVDRDEESIHILDVTLIPAHRNQGIGSGLLRELLAEATDEGKVVRIFVETFNPSQNLFQRLGFSPVADEGFNRLYEWRPEV